MNNLSGIHEKLYRCTRCDAIYYENELGKIRLNTFSRTFCTICQCENLELITEETENLNGNT